MLRKRVKSFFLFLIKFSPGWGEGGWVGGSKAVLSPVDQGVILYISGLNIRGCPISTKSFMNVLGVTFDYKLNWQTHVNNSISKAKRALYAVRLLKPHFNKSLMKTLLLLNPLLQLLNLADPIPKFFL